MKKAQQPKISPVVNTSNILKTYLGDEMEKWKILPAYASYLLEAVFGSKIHNQIDGFIQFTNEDKSIDVMDIKITLAHDLGGALNQDKMMLPRVSEYGKYSILKK